MCSTVYIHFFSFLTSQYIYSNLEVTAHFKTALRSANHWSFEFVPSLELLRHNFPTTNYTDSKKVVWQYGKHSGYTNDMCVHAFLYCNCKESPLYCDIGKIYTEKYWYILYRNVYGIWRHTSHVISNIKHLQLLAFWARRLETSRRRGSPDWFLSDDWICDQETHMDMEHVGKMMKITGFPMLFCPRMTFEWVLSSAAWFFVNLHWFTKEFFRLNDWGEASQQCDGFGEQQAMPQGPNVTILPQ